MTIKSIQKVIKVGSSLAVTIPARDARNLGITAGSEVVSSVSVVPEQQIDTPAIIDEYEEFKKQYHKTLENLAER